MERFNKYQFVADLEAELLEAVASTKSNQRTKYGIGFTKVSTTPSFIILTASRLYES